MRVLIVMLLCAACHQVKKQEFRLDESEHSVSDTTSDKSEKVEKTRAETDTDTKTTKQDNAVLVQEPDGSLQIAVIPKGRPLTLPKGTKVVGTVPVQTVQTETNKKTGPVTEMRDTSVKTAGQVEGDKHTKAEGSGETVTDSGPGWKFYLSCLAGFVILLAAGYTYLKLVKKVSWL